MKRSDMMRWTLRESSGIAHGFALVLLLAAACELMGYGVCGKAHKVTEKVTAAHSSPGTVMPVIAFK